MAYFPGQPNMHINMHIYDQHHSTIPRLPPSPAPAALLNNPPATSISRNPSTVSRRKGPPETKPSRLLSDSENQLVFDILGKGRQTISTALVQLLFPTSTQWKLRDFGVLCFVRDSLRKSYFLEVLSLRMRKIIFSQEIYEEFAYSQPNSQLKFLQFEGDEFMVGLSFADVKEMKDFQAVLDNKIAAKRKRQIERQSRMYDQANNGTLTSEDMKSLLSGMGSPINEANPRSPTTTNTRSHPPPANSQSSFGTIGRRNEYSRPNNNNNLANNNNNAQFLPRIETNQVKTSHSETTLPITTSITLRNTAKTNKKFQNSKQKNAVRKGSSKKKQKIGKKEKLTKADIGLPTNFVHIEHAGFSASSGFTNDILNEKYKQIFDKAGISAMQLQDTETKAFIYEFIKTYEDSPKVIQSPVKRQAGGGQISYSDQSFASSIPQVQKSSENISRSNVSNYTAPPPVPARALQEQRKQNPTKLRPTEQIEPTSSKGPDQTLKVNSSAIPAPPPLPPILSNHLTQEQKNQITSPIPGTPAPPPPPPMPPSNEPTTSYMSNEFSSEVLEDNEEYSLKHETTQSPIEDERSALMKQIQGGVALKKVEPGTKSTSNGASISGDSSSAGSNEIDGIAGALARALLERSRAINPETSSSSEDEGDDGSESDDWK